MGHTVPGLARQFDGGVAQILCGLYTDLLLLDAARHDVSEASTQRRELVVPLWGAAGGRQLDGISCRITVCSTLIQRAATSSMTHGHVTSPGQQVELTGSRMGIASQGRHMLELRMILTSPGETDPRSCWQCCCEAMSPPPACRPTSHMWATCSAKMDQNKVRSRGKRGHSGASRLGTCQVRHRSMFRRCCTQESKHEAPTTTCEICECRFPRWFSHLINNSRVAHVV